MSPKSGIEKKFIRAGYMKRKKFKEVYVIRLETGERIVEKLIEFCEKAKIEAGYLSGIGTCRGAELGFFDWQTKKYSFKKFKGDYEITSFDGNISLFNGRPFLHAHIVLGDRHFHSWSGHLKEAEVLATCEIILTRLDGEFVRKTDKKSGLNLLRLSRP
jgi:predicted DNA-binding protein with PD1-like motif